MFFYIIGLIFVAAIFWLCCRKAVQQKPKQLWVVGRKKNGEDMKAPSDFILKLASHVSSRDDRHRLRRVNHAFWSVLPVPNDTDPVSFRRVIRAQINCEFPFQNSELSKHLVRCRKETSGGCHAFIILQLETSSSV